MARNAGNCDAACISLQNVHYLHVDMLKNWWVGEGSIELSKCDYGIPSRFQVQWALFLLQGSYDSHHVCIIPTESLIEPCEPEEHVHIPNWFWHRPVINRGYRVWLHANSIPIDEKSEAADFPNSELSLWSFAIESKLLLALEHILDVVMVLRLIGSVAEYSVKVIQGGVVNIGL
jgi:hypothetical protein